MTVAHDLARACRLIEVHGWAQARPAAERNPTAAPDGTMAYCTTTAIHESCKFEGRSDDPRFVIGYSNRVRDCFAAVLDIVKPERDHLFDRSNPMLIWAWNDAPERTADEVMETLHQAAVTMADKLGLGDDD
ncbi:hypothetical protein D869_gp130 [Caulobacter phage CcrRogue]|uniref:Uncharacterized protein n=1 Tax=Caulobacter phage CcrRogue TaxID=2927986 RepID=K4JNH7_9CAUD|nr:hypothetical protein D869_gp130 [Caulobacter phage CcrRogue]AFU86784.1 hypothetical protein CcrRogue_gp302 [Caulobacter phage CcrRogue]